MSSSARPGLKMSDKLWNEYFSTISIENRGNQKEDVVVVSSDSEDESEHEHFWSSYTKSSGFKKLWKRARFLIFRRLFSSYSLAKSNYSSLEAVVEDQICPYLKLQQLSNEVLKFQQDDSLKSEELTYLWKNVIQWLIAIKLSSGPLDLNHDEKFNLILIDFMVQYVNYKTKLHCGMARDDKTQEIVEKIMQTMSVIFNGRSSLVIMTLLRIELKLEYHHILDPIFRTYLTDCTLCQKSNDFVVYIRLVLCFKRWKTIIKLKSDREKINEIAIGKSMRDLRSEDLAEVLDLTTDPILPKIVPNFNDQNKAFESISDLIRYAIAPERKAIGTRILLVYKSLDLDNAIPIYFRLYERLITGETVCGNELSEITPKELQSVHDPPQHQHKLHEENAFSPAHLSKVCDKSSDIRNNLDSSYYSISLSDDDISINLNPKFTPQTCNEMFPQNTKPKSSPQLAIPEKIILPLNEDRSVIPVVLNLGNRSSVSKEQNEKSSEIQPRCRTLPRKKKYCVPGVVSSTTGQEHNMADIEENTLVSTTELPKTNQPDSSKSENEVVQEALLSSTSEHIQRTHENVVFSAPINTLINLLETHPTNELDIVQYTKSRPNPLIDDKPTCSKYAQLGGLHLSENVISLTEISQKRNIRDTADDVLPKSCSLVVSKQCSPIKSNQNTSYVNGTKSQEDESRENNYSLCKTVPSCSKNDLINKNITVDSDNFFEDNRHTALCKINQDDKKEEHYLNEIRKSANIHIEILEKNRQDTKKNFKIGGNEENVFKLRSLINCKLLKEILKNRSIKVDYEVNKVILNSLDNFQEKELSKTVSSVLNTTERNMQTQGLEKGLTSEIECFSKNNKNEKQATIDMKISHKLSQDFSEINISPSVRSETNKIVKSQDNQFKHLVNQNIAQNADNKTCSFSIKKKFNENEKGENLLDLDKKPHGTTNDPQNVTIKTAKNSKLSQKNDFETPDLGQCVFTKTLKKNNDREDNEKVTLNEDTIQEKKLVETSIPKCVIESKDSTINSVDRVDLNQTYEKNNSNEIRKSTNIQIENLKQNELDKTYNLELDTEKAIEFNSQEDCQLLKEILNNASFKGDENKTTLKALEISQEKELSKMKSNVSNTTEINLKTFQELEEGLSSEMECFSKNSKVDNENENQATSNDLKILHDKQFIATEVLQDLSKIDISQSVLNETEKYLMNQEHLEKNIISQNADNKINSFSINKQVYENKKIENIDGLDKKQLGSTDDPQNVTIETDQNSKISQQNHFETPDLGQCVFPKTLKKNNDREDNEKVTLNKDTIEEKKLVGTNIPKCVIESKESTINSSDLIETNYSNKISKSTNILIENFKQNEQEQLNKTDNLEKELDTEKGIELNSQANCQLLKEMLSNASKDDVNKAIFKCLEISKEEELSKSESKVSNTSEINLKNFEKLEQGLTSGMECSSKISKVNNGNKSQTTTKTLKILHDKQISATEVVKDLSETNISQSVTSETEKYVMNHDYQRGHLVKDNISQKGENLDDLDKKQLGLTDDPTNLFFKTDKNSIISQQSHLERPDRVSLNEDIIEETKLVETNIPKCVIESKDSTINSIDHVDLNQAFEKNNSNKRSKCPNIQIENLKKNEKEQLDKIERTLKKLEQDLTSEIECSSKNRKANNKKEKQVTTNDLEISHEIFQDLSETNISQSVASEADNDVKSQNNQFEHLVKDSFSQNDNSTTDNFSRNKKGINGNEKYNNLKLTTNDPPNVTIKDDKNFKISQQNHSKKPDLKQDIVTETESCSKKNKNDNKNGKRVTQASQEKKLETNIPEFEVNDDSEKRVMSNASQKKIQREKNIPQNVQHESETNLKKQFKLSKSGEVGSFLKENNNEVEITHKKQFYNTNLLISQKNCPEVTVPPQSIFSEIESHTGTIDISEYVTIADKIKLKASHEKNQNKISKTKENEKSKKSKDKPSNFQKNAGEETDIAQISTNSKQIVESNSFLTYKHGNILTPEVNSEESITKTTTDTHNKNHTLMEKDMIGNEANLKDPTLSNYNSEEIIKAATALMDMKKTNNFSNTTDTPEAVNAIKLVKISSKNLPSCIELPSANNLELIESKLKDVKTYAHDKTELQENCAGTTDEEKTPSETLTSKIVISKSILKSPHTISKRKTLRIQFDEENLRRSANKQDNINNIFSDEINSNTSPSKRKLSKSKKTKINTNEETSTIFPVILTSNRSTKSIKKDVKPETIIIPDKGITNKPKNTKKLVVRIKRMKFAEHMVSLKKHKKEILKNEDTITKAPDKSILLASTKIKDTVNLTTAELKNSKSCNNLILTGVESKSALQDSKLSLINNNLTSVEEKSETRTYDDNLIRKEMESDTPNEVIASLKILSKENTSSQLELITDKKSDWSIGSIMSEKSSKLQLSLEQSIESVLPLLAKRNDDAEKNEKNSPIKRLDVLKPAEINKLYETQSVEPKITSSNQIKKLSISLPVEEETTKKVSSKNSFNDVKIPANVPKNIFDEDDESENSESENNVPKNIFNTDDGSENNESENTRYSPTFPILSLNFENPSTFSETLPDFGTFDFIAPLNVSPIIQSGQNITCTEVPKTSQNGNKICLEGETLKQNSNKDCMISGFRKKTHTEKYTPLNEPTIMQTKENITSSQLPKTPTIDIKMCPENMSEKQDQNTSNGNPLSIGQDSFFDLDIDLDDTFFQSVLEKSQSSKSSHEKGSKLLNTPDKNFLLNSSKKSTVPTPFWKRTNNKKEENEQIKTSTPKKPKSVESPSKINSTTQQIPTENSKKSRQNSLNMPELKDLSPVLNSSNSRSKCTENTENILITTVTDKPLPDEIIHKTNQLIGMHYNPFNETNAVQIQMNCRKNESELPASPCPLSKPTSTEITEHSINQPIVRFQSNTNRLQIIDSGTFKEDVNESVANCSRSTRESTPTLDERSKDEDGLGCENDLLITKSPKTLHCTPGKRELSSAHSETPLPKILKTDYASKSSNTNDIFDKEPLNIFTSKFENVKTNIECVQSEKQKIDNNPSSKHVSPSGPSKFRCDSTSLTKATKIEVYPILKSPTNKMYHGSSDEAVEIIDKSSTETVKNIDGKPIQNVFSKANNPTESFDENNVVSKINIERSLNFYRSSMSNQDCKGKKHTNPHLSSLLNIKPTQSLLCNNEASNMNRTSSTPTLDERSKDEDGLSRKNDSLITKSPKTLHCTPGKRELTSAQSEAPLPKILKTDYASKSSNTNDIFDKEPLNIFTSKFEKVSTNNIECAQSEKQKIDNNPSSKHVSPSGPSKFRCNSTSLTRATKIDVHPILESPPNKIYHARAFSFHKASSDEAVEIIDEKHKQKFCSKANNPTDLFDEKSVLSKKTIDCKGQKHTNPHLSSILNIKPTQSLLCSNEASNMNRTSSQKSNIKGQKSTESPNSNNTSSHSQTKILRYNPSSACPIKFSAIKLSESDETAIAEKLKIYKATLPVASNFKIHTENKKQTVLQEQKLRLEFKEKEQRKRLEAYRRHLHLLTNNRAQHPAVSKETNKKPLASSSTHSSSGDQAQRHSIQNTEIEESKIYRNKFSEIGKGSRELRAPPATLTSTDWKPTQASKAEILEYIGKWKK